MFDLNYSSELRQTRLNIIEKIKTELGPYLEDVDALWQASIGLGWWCLLEEFSKRLLLLGDELTSFRFLQVKQKFGELRIYFNSNDEVKRKIFNLTEELSARSKEICEHCASPVYHGPNSSELNALCAGCLDEKNILTEMSAVKFDLYLKRCNRFEENIKSKLT